MCDFIPQLKGGREVHVVRPRVSVENELADWKTTKMKNSPAASVTITHVKTTQIFGYSIQQRCLFFVQTRVQWCSGGSEKKIKIKKNRRRLGGKILHHSLSNIFAYRCKSDRGSVGVLRWFSSQRRCPVCRGPTAERVPSPPAPPPPPASPPPLSWPWAPGSSCTPWLWAAGWRCCWPCSFPGTCWCWSRWAGRWPWRWETRGGENGYITWGWHDTAVEIWKRCHMISSKDFM